MTTVVHDILHTLGKRLPAGDVIDAGANIGGYTFLYAGEQCNAKMVHAFEPGPGTFKRLKQRGEELGLKNVIYNNLGLSNEPGMLHAARFFNTWSLFPVAASPVPYAVTTGDGNEGHATFNVMLTTVDIYAETHVQNLVYFKVDTDGYDLKVLQGAEKSIAKWRPPIFLELSYLIDWYGNTRAEMVEWIFSHDYRTYLVYGDEYKTREELMKCHLWDSSGDVLCVPREMGL
jgi:FkbM family methyltransferase